jgi:hypothetical protein
MKKVLAMRDLELGVLSSASLSRSFSALEEALMPSPLLVSTARRSYSISDFFLQCEEAALSPRTPGGRKHFPMSSMASEVLDFRKMSPGYEDLARKVMQKITYEEVQDFATHEAIQCLISRDQLFDLSRDGPITRVDIQVLVSLGLIKPVLTSSTMYQVTPLSFNPPAKVVKKLEGIYRNLMGYLNEFVHNNLYFYLDGTAEQPVVRIYLKKSLDAYIHSTFLDKSKSRGVKTDVLPADMFSRQSMPVGFWVQLVAGHMTVREEPSVLRSKMFDIFYSFHVNDPKGLNQKFFQVSDPFELKMRVEHIVQQVTSGVFDPYLATSQVQFSSQNSVDRNIFHPKLITQMLDHSAYVDEPNYEGMRDAMLKISEENDMIKELLTPASVRCILRQAMLALCTHILQNIEAARSR